MWPQGKIRLGIWHVPFVVTELYSHAKQIPENIGVDLTHE